MADVEHISHTLVRKALELHWQRVRDRELALGGDPDDAAVHWRDVISGMTADVVAAKGTDDGS